MIAVREREAQALKLRKDGATYASIAQSLGWYDESGAKKAIGRALARIGEEDAKILRQIEAERLGDLYAVGAGIMASKHVILHDGKPVLDADGNPYDDDGIRLKALNSLRQVSESYRSLIGLDAPSKSRVDVSGEIVVWGVDQIAGEIARLEAELQTPALGEGEDVLDVEGEDVEDDDEAAG